jgi:hypothetical protein
MAKSRRDVSAAVTGPRGYSLVTGPAVGGDKYPTYRQDSTGILFRRIPSGTAVIGLTDRHEQLARAIEPRCFTSKMAIKMKPATPQKVRSLLVSVSPASQIEVCRIEPDLVQPTVDGVQKVSFHAPPIVTETPDKRTVRPNRGRRLPQHLPALVDWPTADALVRKIGCRLPTEVEWEYLCRGGASTLFAWGESIPTANELSGWFVPDYSYQPTKPCNGFGLYDLFCGEWCSSEYRESYQPGAEVQKGVRVVRGRAAALGWPWQDCEWLWALPCMRMPSTASNDPRYAIRFVRDW